MKIEFEDNNNIWGPISDLMSGLMMVFILIAISYMIKSTDAARVYKKNQVELVKRLNEELKDDLNKWNARIIDSTLSVQFLSKDGGLVDGMNPILFKKNSHRISNWFKSNLDEFFPKFFSIIYSDEFRDIIEELRVEGHTDSDEGYFYNVELSQGRSREVLRYCYNKINNDVQKKWLEMTATANGLSYSKLIFYENGEENQKSSRRVEFRIKTNSESTLKQILK
ncbi:MAG: OmpA/MotB family protein [Flavobacteriaceae bacterium]